MVLRKELGFFAVVVVFALAVSLIAYTVASANPWNLSVRLFALNGFIALSIAAIMTAFLKEITLFFKKPFTKIHHYFAAAGLVLITLHPIILAIQRLNPAVFIPNLDSLYQFFAAGGRQALIIIYIAIAAVLLRRKIPSYWRVFHALMYVALFFGIVHANLLGTDFENIAVLIIFNGLFVAVLAAFVWKRWQFYRMKTRRKKPNA
jgi:DMSO/TMAO reductase YedYZ heme-binding membrane subunit